MSVQNYSMNLIVYLHTPERSFTGQYYFNLGPVFTVLTDESLNYYDMKYKYVVVEALHLS